MSNTKKFNGAIKVGNSNSDPTDTESGVIYYNTTENNLKFRNNTEYKSVLGSVSDDPNPTLSNDLELDNNAVANSSGDLELRTLNSIKRSSTINPSNFIEEEYIHSIALLDSISDWTIQELSFDPNIYEGCEITYKVKDTSGAVRVGRLMVATNGEVMSLFDGPSAETSLVDITFDSELRVGEFSSFFGQVAGMTEDVIIRADKKGSTGNVIELQFDGIDNITTSLATWNAANPDNTATLIYGNGSQIPNNLEVILLQGGLGEYASFTGQVAGMTTNVTIEADNIGDIGNSVSLNFDGIGDINSVITTWNSINPNNTITLVSGDGSQMPNNGQNIALVGGDNGSVFALIKYNSGAEAATLRVDVKRILA